jgi:hypothetical protein
MFAIGLQGFRKPENKEKKRRALKFEGGMEIPQLFSLNHLFFRSM